MRNTILLIGFILSFLSNDVFSQPLSGILPKHQAYEYSQTPVFTWNELNGALDYTVILSQDPTFVTGVIQSPLLTVTSWTSNSLTFGTWYWKVSANTGSGSQMSPSYQLIIYDPSQNANLSLWLKADAGITLDGFGKVQTWTDLSPNAYSLSQTIDSKRPSVVPVSLNNLPSLSFNGSHFLNGGDILDIGTSSRSMFVVGKMGASNQTLFAKSLAALASNRYAFIKNGSASSFIYQDLAEHHIASAYNTTNHALYSGVSSRSSSKNRFEVNNYLIGQSSINSSDNMNSAYRFLIGAYNNATDAGEVLFLTGNISEMVFIDSSDSSEVLKAENYLRYKYAPPVNLGKDTTLNHFCSINLTAPSGFTNLLWSTGATTSTISVNQTGEYWLQGTDIFGYVSRDTIQVTYPSVPPPTFTGICVNETMIWNADLGPGFTYLWSPNGETTPSISISAAGTYSVQVTDALLCTKNSGDYTFAIDTYSQTTFLGNDTTLCTGNLIGLQVGAAETVSYIWPDASTATQYAVDTTGNYFVESTNVNGCVAQDTMHVTITGTAPVADFSFQNECLNQANIFTDQSVPAGADAIAIWNWNMGNGSPIQNTQNVNYTYPASGTYNVQLYVESVGGCGAYRTETVQVYANPTANFSSAGHCQNQLVQFTNTSALGDAALTNYFWDFDMPWSIDNNSIIPVPNRDFDTARTYDVFFRVTDANGCKDSIVIPVVIDPTPVAEFIFVDACVNTPINFTNTSVTQPFSTYFWDFDDGTNSILTNPSKTYSSPGGKLVTLEVTNSFACIGTVQHNVEIFANPVAMIDLGPYCMGTYMEATDFSTVSGGTIDSSIWVFNTTDSLIGSPVKYLIPTMGQQSVSLTTFSNQGCSSTVNQFFNVTSELQASFDIGAGIAAAGSPFTFTNTSTSDALYLWNFGDGSFSSDFSPEHSYDESYIDSALDVYLIVLNIEGCVDTAFQTVLIDRAKIDLELNTLYLQKQGDWYIVGVKMTNKGSVDLASANLMLETSSGLIFNETWNGTLAPLEDSIYVFTAQVGSNFSDQDGVDAFICVQGIGFDENGVEETYLDNNKVCKNIEGKNVILMPIYPNPVVDELHVQLIVSVESEVSVTLIDLRGREVKRIVSEQTLAAGLYDYTLNIDQIQAGAYYVRMISGDAVVKEKVVVGN